MGTIVAEVIYTGDRDSRGRRRVTAAQRADYVRAYRESGLNQAAFAKREGLVYSTFCHWVQKAAKGLLRMPPSAPVSSASRHGAVQFAQVQLPTPRSASSTAAELDTASVELQLPDGMVVRGADVQKLAALVRALRS
jgi:transposase-like protein